MRARIGSNTDATPPAAMVTLQFTRHLFAFFPQLDGRDVRVEATSVAEALAALEGLAPGIGFYLRDELGRVRPHVNLFVNTERIRDRKALTDPLRPGDTLWILQALSGG
ncbi:MAG: MoaD/ThiS family protein [Myxococcota bacterium]